MPWLQQVLPSLRLFVSDASSPPIELVGPFRYLSFYQRLFIVKSTSTHYVLDSGPDCLRSEASTSISPLGPDYPHLQKNDVSPPPVLCLYKLTKIPDISSEIETYSGAVKQEVVYCTCTVVV